MASLGHNELTKQIIVDIKVNAMADDVLTPYISWAPIQYKDVILPV